MYAMILNKRVDFVIITPPLAFGGWDAVEIPEDLPVASGWYYVDGEWLDENQVPPAEYILPAGDKPEITLTQKLVQGPPEKRDGGWYYTWEIVELDEEEIAALTLSTKEQKKQQIESKRDTILKAGFHFTHEEKDLSLQTRDDEDRINWLGVLNASSAMIMAGAGDSPTKIRTAENEIITLTYSQAQLLMLQTLNYQSSVYESAWHHKDALDLLTTLEEVTAYDVESGWPS